MKKRIPLNLVIPNPDQPRKHFDPVKIRELAESIRERGLIQAITVRPVFLTDVQPTRIKARTALLNLDETIQKLVDSGAFPLGHANDLVDLPTADQISIVRLFSSGKLKDWSSIKAAAQAVRDRIEQGGMFDDENRPEPSKDDIAAMSRMEKTVERIIAAIAGGFKDGECIALKSVDPTKADKWADTLAAASRSIRSMESQLRQAHARSMLV
ncbi:ParB N-terminal domain-containing protein [Mesorhizobium sp. M00.F.Ca.ET.217.01.1.1]|uniref:ParB N-terminal domain-containing protein n=1 Tax=Mesorhizobium sp. M00.F.Ca.ET.217.01.1.1 TaxID=2500529 RepID=UPI001AEE1B73|nr:ParB N-terminal domain-containing protein [Mesorhizobium sp. M00.F.Ca.ET.217.01.1.1]